MRAQVDPRGREPCGKPPRELNRCPAKPGIKERKYLMSKKLITAAPGLVAFAALALPAAASATSPVLTHPTGTAYCPNGSNTCKLTGTNIGNTKFKSGGSTLSECTTAKLTGWVAKNKETHIEGNITTATFSGNGAEFDGMNECLGFFGFGNLTPTTNGTHPLGTKVDNEDVTHGTPWCMTAGGELGANEFTIRGGTCDETSRTMTFVLASTSAGTCKYERTTAIRGNYTTVSKGDAIFTLTSTNTLFTGEAGNPGGCSASGSLEMSFTMETDSATPEPLYIS
jgi:hypothetical protein